MRVLGLGFVTEGLGYMLSGSWLAALASWSCAQVFEPCRATAKAFTSPSQFGFSRIFIAEKEYSVPFFRGLALQNAKLVSVLLLKFRRPSALYYSVEFSNIKTQKKYWMFHFPQVNSASPVRLLRGKELYFLLQHRGSVVHKAKLVGRCGSWTILC